jgi:hypothetical protein
MSSLLIRDIPETTLQAFKRRAARHHRSLQKEIIFLLEESARMSPQGDNPEHRSLRLKTVKTKNKAPWERSDLYGEDGR